MIIKIKIIIIKMILLFKYKKLIKSIIIDLNFINKWLIKY